MPIFSIVVPVYNVENYIYKCLDSIARQTIYDIEVILIDDGSTDSSLLICESFCSKDSRFHVFSKKNEGQGIARNLGMTYANGEYISFIDSDDWIEPNLFEVALELLEGSSADFINFGVDFINLDDIQVKKFANYKYNKLDGSTIFHHSLVDDQILSVVWNKVFRRKVIFSNQIAFPDIRAIEDIYFSRAISKFSSSIVFTNQILYHALVRPNSSSRLMNIQSFIDAELLLNLEYKNFFNEFSNVNDLSFFGAHVLKFYTYLQIQSAFRVQNYSEYINCYNFVNNSLLYKSFLKINSLKKLRLKNKILILMCRFPFLLRISAKFLRPFGVIPY
jgi:glycosyltransferase involved in cell wall biosynthesis